ncbi:MAG TPA: alpha-2-macroglobulin family protein [Chloroflexota bacterium]|nr:alpha-2-macroglobulin family protein [Chloroflexota bacterium]
MQRFSRRAFLAVSVAGLSAVACSGPSPFALRRPGPTPIVPLPGRSATPLPALTAGPTPLLPTPSVGPAQTVDGYVAVAPSVLRAGQREAISLSLFQGDQPASGDVTVALSQNGQPVANATARITGRGSLALQVPDLADGSYDLQVSARGFQDQTPVQVQSGTLVFLESDKPIYQPGQTVHFRVLALAPSLKPASGIATVEVMDAKGIKIFKQIATVDDFGMASVDLPLSTEPNLGVWKANATIGNRTAELDVRVEEYVLPKYAVTVDLQQDWALASDPIDGTISAQYSYGKPVAGDVEITAQRYVGTWQQYAKVSQPIDGKMTFEIPAVRYAVGSPGAGGMSNVRLDVTVKEQSTGYQETTSQLVTIAALPIDLQVIPESPTFKPTLPFSVLAVAQTPDKKPVDLTIAFSVTYQDSSFKQLQSEAPRVATSQGLAVLKLTPPAGAATLTIVAQAKDAMSAKASLSAGYSPSSSFIHVEQTTTGALKVGDTAHFAVTSTRGSTNFYYEVVARGQVAFSDFSPTADLAIALAPSMAPEFRLLVYQILSNGEVAADYVPVKVAGDYPQQVQLGVDRPQVKPGDALNVKVQAEGQARVGLVAVDKSVFILAENRLNLQQVFDELEQLYLKPQVELDSAQPINPFGPITLPGARETFQDAGVVVLTNRQVPASQQIQRPQILQRQAFEGAMPMAAAARAADAAAPTAAPAAPAAQQAAASNAAPGQPLAEVQRVRQFFPETWLWDTFDTDASGQITRKVTAPDSITTWMLRAVALSKDKGLGIGEAQVKVFQPFFVQVDLPYSAIRGEQFPARVALYNYQATTQQFVVDLDPANWFDLIDVKSKTVTVGPNQVGGLSFGIRPTGLGVGSLKVTARSQTAADAIVKDLLVEAEGIKREVVENAVVAAGAAKTLDLSIPANAIAGSSRAFIALTGNILSQTIDGLDGLLQMPFGCGEQNMINFAPDVFVAQYLKDTTQLKPAVMAKAELLMLTGYQRELTYRRTDGSFSAFGQSDPEGSLWLTAFVMKTFAQARDLIFIDDAVLSAARAWVGQHQNADGSFDPFGFIHHQDLLGGLSGKTALTAYVAIALRAAGDDSTAARAVRYLEGALGAAADAYSVATTAYALALAKSGQAPAAHDKLMGLAHQSDDGIWWGEELLPLPVGPSPLAVPGAAPLPVQPGNGGAAVMPPIPGPILPILRSSAVVETTAYATLALLQIGDSVNASRAVRWLASQRNAYGGFGSTQDTIVALQALTTAATGSRSDTDATITLKAGSWRKDVRISADNADVLQVIEVPLGQSLSVQAAGKGQVMTQSVRRFNVPDAAPAAQSAFQIDVQYGTDKVEVNDQITVTATIKFTPPEPIEAGMVVLDVSVPTGFAADAASLDAAVKAQPKLKRYDLAGRKVILYIENMLPNDELTVSFQAKALYPVRAKASPSQVYSYYRPDWKGESLGGAIEVS